MSKDTLEYHGHTDGDQSEVVDNTNDLGACGGDVRSEGSSERTCTASSVSCLHVGSACLDFDRVSPSPLLIPHEDLHLLVSRTTYYYSSFN